jgi:hypothetical protein
MVQDAARTYRQGVSISPGILPVSEMGLTRSLLTPTLALRFSIRPISFILRSTAISKCLLCCSSGLQHSKQRYLDFVDSKSRHGLNFPSRIQ